MKYFKIDIKRFYENDMIATNANGDEIPDGNLYFRKMDKGEVIINPPLFDYFFLESFDKKKYWEWLLCDVYSFLGKSSQIPGWLISRRLKGLLEKYKITTPHFIYRSKLLYKKEKLTYYIFQYMGKNFTEDIRSNISFSRSVFYDPNSKMSFGVKNKVEFVIQKKKIRKESIDSDKGIGLKKLFLKRAYDFFPMQSFLRDNIVSERLKNAIEENHIIGFEFSELEYEVVVEKSV